MRWLQAGKSWHATWHQVRDGAPVLGCYVDLTLDAAGEVVAFTSSLVPRLQVTEARVDAEEAVRTCEGLLSQPLRILRREDVVAVTVLGGGYRGLGAVQVDVEGPWGARWRATVGAGARLLELEDLVRTVAFEGLATARIVPVYGQDAPVTRELRWLRVGLYSERENFDVVTSLQGSFFVENAMSGAYRLESALQGLFVRLRNDAGDPQPLLQRTVHVPGTAVLLFEDGNSRLDERTIYYHATRVHDYARDTFDFTLLDFPMLAVAAVRHPQTGDPDYANAFWNGEGIHFGTGGGVYHNLGLYADVIYHEYVHGITDYMYRPARGLPGLEGGAIHEALSDYFACTLTGDPLVAENAFRDAVGSYLRNLENSLIWPQDRRFQVHRDGEILAGAFWDLRRLLGPATADALVHFARTTFPKTFEAYANAVLLQDDLLFGDGAADNGSPNRDAILAAFAVHGLGPTASADRRLVHDPLRDTEAVGVDRALWAGFELDLSARNDTLRLHVAVDGGPFVSEIMRRDAQGRFHGEIPGALLTEGAAIRYYITAAATRSRPQLTHPPGAPQFHHTFLVGPDLQPPSVQHHPITQAAHFTWPIDLVVRLDDNLGIGEAAVEFFYEGEPAGWGGLRRSPEDAAMHVARFPNIGRLGERIGYRIAGVDASRAQNRVVLPETGVYELELVEALLETFEAGSGGWRHASLVVGRPDLWHLANGRNHTPSGERAWLAGVAEGEYPPNLSLELVTDVYPLGSGARAGFWSWMDAEPNGLVEAFDGGVLQIRDDGAASGGWETLVPLGGYSHRIAAGGGGRVLRPGMPCISGRRGGWERLDFDLAAYAGRRVRLRFLFESDPVPSPFGLRGWAVDDFDLHPGAAEATDVSPRFEPRARLLSRVPSPFGIRTSFDLEVPDRAGLLDLGVFDARGRLVRQLVSGPLAAGRHRLVWDGRDGHGLASPSGVYYYRLQSRFGTESGTVVRLRPPVR